MCLTSTFVTTSKQHPDLRDIQRTDTILKNFNVITEEHKSYLPNTSSTDEEKCEDRKLTLLDLAKWAQERQWKWKGSPDVGTNHDAYFFEAAEEALEAKKQRSL